MNQTLMSHTYTYHVAKYTSQIHIYIYISIMYNLHHISNNQLTLFSNK
ncbi:hypothetical protein F383_04605 [Gossypium arboreum]|uniref:Uncharacterized protein n=1 Tax=Gossypium arboreum TaxID=29729 RepID=A0A0B0P610_GOSAR|nr:hypothetical protein F383_20391 [Gossypium arboreum]KHG20500.1 hypothetical protein F383_04605 [Gossypium arboreum]